MSGGTHSPDHDITRWQHAVSRHPTALVSRGDLSRLADHAADALAALEVLNPPTGATVVDVGSGAGLPGMLWALARPDLQVHLVESVQRKARFLAECATTLNITSRVTVHGSRSENLCAPGAPLRGIANLVVARALADPAATLELLRPFAGPGGSVAYQTTRSAVTDRDGRVLHRITSAAEHLGLTQPRVIGIASSLRDDGAACVAVANTPCPDRFPRRVGVAVARPLA